MIKMLVRASALLLLAVPRALHPSTRPRQDFRWRGAQDCAQARTGQDRRCEYEKEGGGWRYSFDIRQGKRIHEIGVDANTGKSSRTASKTRSTRLVIWWHAAS